MILNINGQEIPEQFFQQRLQEIYPEVKKRLAGKPPAIIDLTAQDETRDRVIEEVLIDQEIDRVNPPADEALVQQELKKMLKKQDTKRQLKTAGKDRDARRRADSRDEDESDEDVGRGRGRNVYGKDRDHRPVGGAKDIDHRKWRSCKSTRIVLSMHLAQQQSWRYPH